MLEKSAIHSEAPLPPYNEVGTVAAALRFGAFQAIRNSLSQPGRKSQCRLTSRSSEHCPLRGQCRSTRKQLQRCLSENDTLANTSI